MGTQIAADCTPEDQKKALEFANSICEAVGVTVPSEGLEVGGSGSTATAETAPAATDEGTVTTTTTTEEEAGEASGGKEVSGAGESAGPDATETGVPEPSSSVEATGRGEPPVSNPLHSFLLPRPLPPSLSIRRKER